MRGYTTASRWPDCGSRAVEATVEGRRNGGIAIEGPPLMSGSICVDPRMPFRAGSFSAARSYRACRAGIVTAGDRVAVIIAPEVRSSTTCQLISGTRSLPTHRPDAPLMSSPPSTGTATSAASATPSCPRRERAASGRCWRPFRPNKTRCCTPVGLATGPGRFVSGPWSLGYPPAAARSAPRRLRRSPVTRGATHTAPPVGRPDPQVGGPYRVPRSPLHARTGAIDGQTDDHCPSAWSRGGSGASM